MTAKRPCFAIADLLRTATARAVHNDTPAEAVDDLVEAFADLFARDNSRFQRGRFYQACEVVAHGTRPTCPIITKAGPRRRLDD
jgi:hypothetical protein